MEVACLDVSQIFRLWPEAQVTSGSAKEEWVEHGGF